MSNITFSVIDTTCEAADPSFFNPVVTMATVSTEKFATVLGYGEFVASKPPKKYRKVTVTGSSQRIGFTAEESPNMAAGAQYIFSGAGEIDLQGHVLSSYSKKFYAQCSKQFWPPVPLQINPNAVYPSRQAFPMQFIGYCWAADTNSCNFCDPNPSNWPFIGEQSTNNVANDFNTAFLVPNNGIVATHTTLSATNQVFYGFTQIFAPSFSWTLSGHHYTFTVGGVNYDAESVFTTPSLVFPVVAVGGFVCAYINFTDTSNFSATLSEEYTDAQALANATVTMGTSPTAATTPRTTGFTSTFTSVQFTLSISNLIVGVAYIATVDFVDVGGGTTKKTKMQYPFTASDVTATITDVVPTPIDFHTITVTNPKVAFNT